MQQGPNMKPTITFEFFDHPKENEIHKNEYPIILRKEGRIYKVYLPIAFMEDIPPYSFLELNAKSIIESQTKPQIL